MPARYTRTAIALHWLMAVMLIGMLALGVYMHDLPLSPHKLQLYAWHKWAGVTAFCLVWLRLAWRLRHRPPALPSTMPGWMQRAAQASHLLLYLLMVVIPLSGWLMSSAKGVQTVWFGVLPLPDLLAKDKALGDLLHGAHQMLNLFFVTVLAIHVGAALKHHFFDRDDVLTRILPARR